MFSLVDSCEAKKQQIVAVFTGTSSGLASFFREPTESRTSRQALAYVRSGNKLYEPSFQLWSLGIFAPGPGVSTVDTVTFDRWTDKVETAMLERMLLSENDWRSNDLCCLSIWGTRIQLGQTSFQMASSLVKLGYAILTYYSAAAKTAHVTYGPEPVCARLAMCTMDPSWTVADIEGMEKREWVDRLREILSRAVCHPHKGDLGGVAAASYLLFCGDVLRKRLDISYRKFSVDLFDYIDVLVNGSVEESDAMEWRNTNTCATSASVSCIQIYRDNLRPSMKTMLGRARLELLFHSGCGTYCYFNCPAFDIVVPIRVEVNGSVEYIPVEHVLRIDSRLFVSCSVNRSYPQDVHP